MQPPTVQDRDRRDRERRSSGRVRLQQTVSIHIPDGPGSKRALTGELVDVAVDGRGAAVLVALGQSVPIGCDVSLRLADGQHVTCVVVSWLGLKRCGRVGMRVHETGHALMRSLAGAG
ncbi:MAG: hypothetical protein OXR73_11625 [Myxococcales bacterium]|nr:hypothetical protein [Myxococcales bacterium]